MSRTCYSDGNIRNIICIHYSKMPPLKSVESWNFEKKKQQYFENRLFKNELPHEKTNNLHMRKQRCRSASRLREADQRLCFRYTDSTIPLLSKSKISSLKPSSVTAQAGLCQTCSKTTLLVFPRGGSNIDKELQNS